MMKEEIVSHRKDEQKIRNLYGGFFQNNREIYLLAGELNPSFYDPLIKNYYHLIKDKTIYIICGPYISVKDEIFQKYYNIHNNHLRNWWYAKERGEWWKAHPIFEAAYQNDNINIYIIKQRYEPHFALGLDSKDVFVEDPHDELSEDKVTIHFDNDKLLQQYLDTWNKIKNEKCYEWNKEPVRRLFKPVYTIKRELELQKKIEEEIACSYKQYLNEKHLTKIEINLPVKTKSIKMFPKIVNLFLDTEGIGGCTYSLPSKPSVFKGLWLNPETKEKVVDDIVWIYACYDIEEASIEAEDLINMIKEIVEKETGEDLAWIIYSPVCFPKT